MKFFPISGFIYPFSVEDAEDGYVELDYDSGIIVLEAWARGIVFREDGSYVTDIKRLAEAQGAWSHAVPDHPYFKAKNEACQAAQAGADEAFFKRLSEVKFGKPTASKGREKKLPVLEG